MIWCETAHTYSNLSLTASKTKKYVKTLLKKKTNFLELASGSFMIQEIWEHALEKKPNFC